MAQKDVPGSLGSLFLQSLHKDLPPPALALTSYAEPLSWWENLFNSQDFTTLAGCFPISMNTRFTLSDFNTLKVVDFNYLPWWVGKKPVFAYPTPLSSTQISLFPVQVTFQRVHPTHPLKFQYPLTNCPSISQPYSFQADHKTYSSKPSYRDTLFPTWAFTAHGPTPAHPWRYCLYSLELCHFQSSETSILLWPPYRFRTKWLEKGREREGNKKRGSREKRRENRKRSGKRRTLFLFLFLFFFNFFFIFKFYFIFKLYITVLVLPNIKMNPPQVYMCSPS